MEGKVCIQESHECVYTRITTLLYVISQENKVDVAKVLGEC